MLLWIQARKKTPYHKRWAGPDCSFLVILLLMFLFTFNMVVVLVGPFSVCSRCDLSGAKMVGKKTSRNEASHDGSEKVSIWGSWGAKSSGHETASCPEPLKHQGSWLQLKWVVLSVIGKKPSSKVKRNQSRFRFRSVQGKLRWKTGNPDFLNFYHIFSLTESQMKYQISFCRHSIRHQQFVGNQGESTMEFIAYSSQKTRTWEILLNHNAPFTEYAASGRGSAGEKVSWGVKRPQRWWPMDIWKKGP